MKLAQPPVQTIWTVDPETSSWGRFWRATVDSIPSTCDSDVCRSLDRPCQSHQTVEGEWVEVFDAFADLQVTNKFIGGAGEGAGKTHHAALFGVLRSRYDYATLGRAGLYWIIGADYEDAYDPCFKYILEHEENLGTIADKRVPKNGRDQCWLKTTDGREYLTVSAKDPQKIAREQPDGFIVEEASRISAEAWQRIYSRAARRPNAWVFASGSFETSRGPFADRFREGQGANENRVRSVSLPSWANRHIYPQGEDDPRIAERRATMSPDRFAERHEGRPANPRGAVLGRFRRELHVNASLEVDYNYPVLMFADPGTHTYALLFVQLVEMEIRVLGEIYEHAISPEELVDKARLTPWWKYLSPYGHVMDFAGRQRNAGNPSAWQRWKDLTGLSFRTTGETVTVEDKAESVLSLLNVNPKTGRPYLQVHPRCAGLISEAGGGESPLAELGIGGTWMRRVDSNTGEVGEILSKNDHAWSALAYGRIIHFGPMRPEPRKTTRRGRNYLRTPERLTAPPRPDGQRLITRRRRYY